MKIKNVCLLVAGTLSGMLGTLVLEDEKECLLISIISIFFLFFILYGLGIIDEIMKSIKIKIRNYNLINTKSVGILNDLDWNNKSEISSWTDFTSKNWFDKINKKILKNKKLIKGKYLKIDKNLELFNYILNPYGGLYPESDTINMKNLQRIFDYVSEGGIFINVADVPGYWMYNTELQIKLETTPSVSSIIQNYQTINYISLKPFEKNSILEKLSLRIINVESTDNSKYSYESKSNIITTEEIRKYRIDRLALVEKNMQPIIICKDLITNNEFSPFFTIPYGKGKFIFCLYFFSDQHKENYNIIDKIIGIMKE